MATYTLKLTSIDDDTKVGQIYSQTFSTSFSSSKPSNWPFTNQNLYTINNVKLTYSGATPGYDNPFGVTSAAPSDLIIQINNTQVHSIRLNTLRADTTSYNLGSISSNLLFSNFSNITLNFNSYVWNSSEIATFSLPSTVSLVFEYTLNYTQLPAPTWNVNIDNYLHNSNIYVSNNSSTPSGKNKITLQWNTPTVSGNPDTLNYYTIKAQVNNTLYNVLTTSNNSYTVDFSNFKYDDGTKTLSLAQGDQIVFRISTTGVYCGTSEERSLSPFYINHWPTAPTISNTIIPSIQTNSNLQYVLGTDSTYENMPVTFRWKQNSNSIWLTSTSITDSMIGTHYAYTYDNWDISSPTSFTISKNTKPIVTFSATFSASSTGYVNNTITINNISIQNGKTLKQIRYYIRAADTRSLLSVANIKTLPLNNNTYVIDPFDTNSLVYAAQYYQVGVQASDGIEDSDIAWSDIVQIYGGIDLLENSPIISHTDTIIGSGDYTNYYKNKTINLTYQLPELPIGLSKLYYQFAYLSNTQNNTWILLGDRVPFNTSYTLNTQVTIPVILSNLVLRVNIYNADIDETQVVHSQNSNTLYYVNAPNWGNNSGSLSLAYTDFADGTMALDGRYCIRPTIGNTTVTADNKSVSAFSMIVPIPNTICQVVGYLQDLLYEVSIIKNNNYYILHNYQSIPNNNNNNDPNFSISFTYEQLQNSNIYNLCANEIEERVGPYTFSIIVSFKDPFSGVIETLKNDLIIDFREKPQPAKNILLGRNGIYNSSNYFNQLKEQISSDTVLFPSIAANSTIEDYAILNGEVLLISFLQDLSYPAQEIVTLYFDLYNKSDELIKTFDVQFIPNIEYYEIPVNNLFQNFNEYYIRVRAKDSQSYSQNISLPENKSNKLVGLDREKPIMSLSNVKIEFSEAGIDYSIPTLSFTKQENAIIILWPESYKQTHAYNRSMVYSSISYSPFCTYSLEFSTSPNFSNILLEVKMGEIYNDYYDNLNTTNLIGNLEDSSLTKIYIRGKIEYATGLECIENLSNYELKTNTQTVYSSILSFTSNQPTVSYRKNAVGINSLPSETDVLSVASYGTKNRILLYGEDLSSGEMIQRFIYLDLINGILSGQNFNISSVLFPIATEEDIEQISF